ncbi:ABC transporter permease [Consotaella aegiceratis]|uniref:ABC transporter permease n=1 Tax=Consotaella aegiceratis TaxID=3097961 RepID=UPI002F3E8A47
MLGYIVRRSLAAIPVLVLVAVAVFSLLQLSPGDPAVLIGGDTATPAQIEAIRHDLHLDQPILARAWAWSASLLSGDLGRSLFSGVPVTTLIAQRAEPTLALTLATIVLAIGIGVPVGIVASLRVGSILDRIVMLLSVLGFSVPVFIVGYCLVLVLSTHLHLLPAQGYKPIAGGILPNLATLIMPALALSGVYMAQIARVTRAAMLEVMSEDFIRTARAKGIRRLKIILVHALPNAGIPIMTVIGFGVGALLGGVVVTETVFNIPGLGSLAADSILRRDYPVIQALTLLFAAIYVLVNLAVDLSYGFFDPRVRSWQGGAR